MKTMRKNAVVKYCGKDKELVKTWGEKFKVKNKEKDFLRLISIQNRSLVYAPLSHVKIVY